MTTPASPPWHVDASLEPDPSDPLAGSDYCAVQRLGAGATSEVFEAEHRALGYRVVVKLLRAEFFVRSDLKHRMRLEAHACARIHHENLVRVLGCGQTLDGRTFIVMERAHGRALEEELRRRGALPVPEALAIATQILAGLSAAHAAGIVHRDIKPANLLLALAPDTALRVKILDFGYAKIASAATDLLASAPRVTTTTDGLMVGTPYYFSPEQADARRDIDARADLYSTGCVLYEMLCGRSPFHDRKAVTELARAHLHEMPPPPSTVAPQPIPPALDAAVMRALAKRREDRFASAAAFKEELMRLQAFTLPVR